MLLSRPAQGEEVCSSVEVVKQTSVDHERSEFGVMPAARHARGDSAPRRREHHAPSHSRVHPHTYAALARRKRAGLRVHSRNARQNGTFGDVLTEAGARTSLSVFGTSGGSTIWLPSVTRGQRHRRHAGHRRTECDWRGASARVCTPWASPAPIDRVVPYVPGGVGL